MSIISMLNFQQKEIFMQKYFGILRECPLFDNIKDENLIEMLSCLKTQVKGYRKKETIIAEGSPAKHIGIVLSGMAQLERTDYYGNRSIVTAILPSELFGESFACAEAENMPVSVTASEDTEIMLIDCQKVIHSCSNACAFHNRLIFNLLRIVATKNILLNQKAEIISKRTTREKLMAYLFMQAKRHNSDSFTIPYDRQTLADYLEVDRSGLSAEISKLRAEGVLESKRHYFRLLR